MAKSLLCQQDHIFSRYTDLRDEPVSRLLSPIKGYEAAPLVSLEQATATISHFFDGIEDNVFVAKQNCKNPSDDLSQDESASIHLYTMQFDTDPSLYQILNATLRAENRQNIKPWFAFLKLFLTALYKLPPLSLTVWRGVRDVDLSSKYQSGSRFPWWGVSSCTANVEVLKADQFLGKHGTRTLFSIECKNGKLIAPHSYFKDTEKEIVLMPGSYFEVIGQLSPADGLHIIQLKEIDPPVAFVKPPFIKSSHSKPVTVTAACLEPASSQTQQRIKEEQLKAEQLKIKEQQKKEEQLKAEQLKIKEQQKKEEQLKAEELKIKEQQKKEELDQKLKLWQQKHQHKTDLMAKSSLGKPQRKNCGHRCDLETNRKCCACSDQRPIQAGYEKYVDGVGYVSTAKRHEFYCPSCKKNCST